MHQHPVTAPIPSVFIVAWMAMLLVLFVCLSINGVGMYHFSADELMHIDIARGRTLREVLQFSIFEPHPPLGHILRHYWIALSENAAFVRSQSLLFGILTVLLYYRIGKLLGGERVGLLVAALAAFCPPLMMQSYLVRNYAFFTFFVSLNFYYYLRWQHPRDNARLLPFVITGILACLTHLSGVFALATIGGYELLRTRGNKAQLRALAPWILANALIGLVVVAVWIMLLPKGIAPFQSYARGLTEIQWQLALIYPQQTLGFLLPYSGKAIHAPYLLFGVITLLSLVGWRYKPICSLLALTSLGIVLGALLRGGDFYPFMDPRHVLWLLPFVATSCGWALALSYQWLHQKLAAPLSALMLLTMLAGWALYNPDKRFPQIFEYQITEPQWQEMTDYLGNLDARHLIVARRADAVLIDPPGQNPYRHMGDADAITVTVPYHNTHILFDPTRAHSWHYLEDLPLQMIREARARGELDQVDTLVFVNTSWTSRISARMVELMMCDALPKTIRQFPAYTGNELLRPSRIYRTPVTLMIIPKDIFFEQALSPNGSARACLS